jgi:shikimate dehydrogenase
MIKLGLIGHPVAHSRSPSVHRAFGRQLGLDVEYTLHDVTPERLEATIATLGAEGVTGINITLPHKLAAADLAAELSPRAHRAGAVNTLRLADRYGDNTDGAGLVHDLERNQEVDLAGMRILILGASGAARGAAAAILEREPARVVIANRGAARAERLAADVGGVEIEGYTDLELGAFDLILNATSASLAGTLPPLPDQPFDGIAYDLVTLDAPTVFQRWAMAQGANWATDGWGMLVEQAALSWASWGLPAPDATPLLEPERVLRR